VVRATFDYLANVAYKYFDVRDSDHFRGSGRRSPSMPQTRTGPTTRSP
jgi:hypothetical protein